MAVSHRTRIGICAWVRPDGAAGIVVREFLADQETNWRAGNAAIARDFGHEDWQASAHDSLTDVRSALMRDYGIEWFNRARKQIAELAVFLAADLVWC